MKTLRAVVPKLLDNLGLTPGRYGLLSLIDKEVCQHARGAQVVGLKGSWITVEVESPVHYSDLSLRKREILNSIQRSAPDLDLSHLQIKVILKGMSPKSYV